MGYIWMTSDLIKETRTGAGDEEVVQRNIEHRCSPIIAQNYFNEITFLV